MHKILNPIFLEKEEKSLQLNLPTVWKALTICDMASMTVTRQNDIETPTGKMIT